MTADVIASLITAGWAYIAYRVGLKQGHRIGWLRGYYARRAEGYDGEFHPDLTFEQAMHEGKMNPGDEL